MRETLAAPPTWLRRTILTTFAVAGIAGGHMAAATGHASAAGPEEAAAAVDPKAAVAADPCNLVTKTTTWQCFMDDGPTPPPCDVDKTSVGPGERVCTPAAPKDFVFEAYDLVKGLNRCVVTLRASAPEDQSDPGNRPKIGYRTTVKCEQTLRVVNFTPSVHKATGGQIHSTPQVYCHGTCTTTQTIRGDVYAARNEAYVVRVPIHMRLWEGPDPWIAVPPDAKPNSGPASCLPGGFDVYCMLELPIVTGDQTPNTPHIRPYSPPPPPY